MKLLLDTHVFLWIAEGGRRLTRRAERAVKSSQSELWLSPVSLLEAANLVRLGRITLDRSFDDWAAEALSRLACREAPFTFDVALAARTVAVESYDPADRILAATSCVFDLTLLTADQLLLKGEGFKTMRAA